MELIAGHCDSFPLHCSRAVGCSPQCCTWSHTKLNSAPFNCKLWALPVPALLFFYCMFPFSKDSPHNCCMWNAENMALISPYEC